MTPNIQFLINCCKTQPTAIEIEQIQKHLKGLNSEQLSEMVTLAHAHGVFPLVYHASQTHAVKLISEETQTELKQHNMNIVMQNMKMTAELIRIMNLLEENGIEALAFKGPTLSQLAYGDITKRQYCDLDILIKKQDTAKSIKLLTKDEYRPEITLVERSIKKIFACVNVIGLEKSIRIEIHWELLSKNYAIDWEENALWKETDTTTINNNTIPMLTFNTHLLYLCAHGSKHLFERIEWVCDIDRYIKSNTNLVWESLFEEAKSLGIERMLLLGLYLCHKLLASSLPENIETIVINDHIVEKLGDQIILLQFSTSDKQSRSYGTFGLLWRMRENLSDRLRFAYRGMFAPKFDDFKYIELPEQLLFLYPIIRPFRLLIKYFQK